MSFGFSIGDIVLLSQLAYKLYTGVTTGRKAASQDLKELEDVLFSLRCALDHLSKVAQDVLARSNSQPGGAELLQNLDRMISSCGATLQELDNATKKYREVAIDKVEGTTAGDAKRKRTFDDVARRFKINWTKVRWDQEKQSLQQYREKLRSHVDAINIILSSIIWSQANSAETSSKTHHEKTHLLLNQILSSPQTDASLYQMITEIHTHLTSPKPPTPTTLSMPSVIAMSSMNTLLDDRFARQKMLPGLIGTGFGGPSSGWSGPGVTFPFIPPNTSMPYLSRDPWTPQLPSESIHRMSNLVEETNIAMDGTSPKDDMLTDSENFPTQHNGGKRNIPISSIVQGISSVDTPSMLPYKIKPKVSASLIALNAERRAFAAKEYNEYKKRYSEPLNSPANSAKLQAGLQGLFKPLYTVDSEARAVEILRWVEAFIHFIKSESASRGQYIDQVNLLVALNTKVEQSNKRLRNLFYERSDDAGLMGALDAVEQCSKSVRVVKEIEDFQDARDDWEEDNA